MVNSKLAARPLKAVCPAYRVFSVIGIVVVVVAMLGGHAAAAYALGVQTLTCQGARHTSYSPAITYEPQQLAITFTDEYGDRATHPPNPLVAFCTVIDTTGNLPTTITGSSPTATVNSTQSCTTLEASSGAYVQTIPWTGPSGVAVTTSTISWNPPTADRANGSVVVRQTGTVTAGFGTGDTAARVALLSESQLAACSTGVTTLNGTLTITLS